MHVLSIVHLVIRFSIMLLKQLFVDQSLESHENARKVKF